MVMAIDDGREDTLLKCPVLDRTALFCTVTCLVQLCPSVYNHFQGKSSVAHRHDFDLEDECTAQIIHPVKAHRFNAVQSFRVTSSFVPIKEGRESDRWKIRQHCTVPHSSCTAMC